MPRFSLFSLLLFAILVGEVSHFRSTCYAVSPNVILILADDLALGDLSARNGGISRTPNLDRFANESVRFQNAYSASCVCAPARAALLTGRYPHRTGVVTLNMNRYPQLTRMRLDEVTIADVLRANGYATGLIGKWHCGHGAANHPLKRGFDEFEGFSGSQDLSYFDYTLDINRSSVQVDDNYLTDDLSTRAIEFIRRHYNEPFFLHLAHYAPHRPLEAPNDIVQRYRDQGLDEATATIYAMIEVMDRGIGELLAELDRLDLTSKTLVIFASDNGPDPLTGGRFNHDLRGMKYEIYEGGIRVPLFMRWPGRLKPGDRKQLVNFIDLFPTIVDFCNVKHEVSQPIDGISLCDAAIDNAELPERNLFWQWNRGKPNYTHNAAVRNASWKLIRPFVNRKSNPEDSTAQPLLFDLMTDHAESIDTAAAHKDRYSQMLQALDDWCRDVETDRRRSSK